mgnify:CR=1 FL=1|tara:strand:- start:367 stop:1197 length:831 start_codon:yes stop_codon:yes gene_type:complete
MDIKEYRDLQAANVDINNKFSMLQMVEINPTELCNRKCSFCPRSDKKVYPNKNNHITVKTVQRLCEGLKNIQFNNRIGFVGFGEPLLCKTLIPCIKKVKELIPDINWLEINTNGDKLTTRKIKQLYEAGLTHITISMYDSDKTNFFREMRGKIPIELIFRHHYNPDLGYNLDIVNRKEILEKENKIYSKDSCFLPFYKLMLDWNGDILLCNNDWSRQNKFGNVNKDLIENIWFGKELNTFRRNLLLSRKTCGPCKYCSINGKLRGLESVELFLNYS